MSSTATLLAVTACGLWSLVGYEGGFLLPRCSDVQAVRRYRMHLPGMLGVLVFTDVEPS